MQALFNASACSRRNHSLTNKASCQEPDRFSVTGSDSESRHSTEPGDLSNIDISDHSGRSSPRRSLDGSDSETFKPFSPPPGLVMPSAWEQHQPAWEQHQPASWQEFQADGQWEHNQPPPGFEQYSAPRTKLGTRLNSQAPVFVPCFGAAFPLVVDTPPFSPASTIVSLGDFLGPAGPEMGYPPPPPGTFCYSQPPIAVPGHTPLAEKPGCKTKGNGKSGSKTSKKPTVDETLRTNLRDLTLLDPTRVLVVRRIHTLGLDSRTVLEAHFSQFGTVESVLAGHSKGKSIFRNGAARVRPARLGFVLMTSAEAVEAALASGAEHEVKGAMICASRFEAGSMGMLGNEGED